MIPQISPIISSYSKRISNANRPQKEDLDELFNRVIAHDDQGAFEVIFNRTYRSLCHISNRIVNSYEMAEEIVDDVFFSFWKNRKSISVTISFSSYLFVSVRNRSLDYLRKIKNKAIDSSLESVTEKALTNGVGHDPIIYEELAERINRSIQSLPAQCRLIFTMSREQELTYNQIAHQLGLSVKTVDTQMGRALKHLRQEIKGLSS